MIDRKNNPVEWAMLIYELDDARDHLETLLTEMSESEDFTDDDYAAYLGHIFSHLNRAWNMRSIEGQVTDDHSQSMSQFPTDLKPVG